MILLDGGEALGSCSEVSHVCSICGIMYYKSRGSRWQGTLVRSEEVEGMEGRVTCKRSNRSDGVMEWRA